MTERQTKHTKKRPKEEGGPLIQTDKDRERAVKTDRRQKKNKQNKQMQTLIEKKTDDPERDRQVAKQTEKAK